MRPLLLRRTVVPALICSGESTNFFFFIIGYLNETSVLQAYTQLLLLLFSTNKLLSTTVSPLLMMSFEMTCC